MQILKINSDVKCFKGPVLYVYFLCVCASKHLRRLRIYVCLYVFFCVFLYKAMTFLYSSSFPLFQLRVLFSVFWFVGIVKLLYQMCVSRFKFVYPCRSTQLYKLMALRHGLAKLTALLLIFCPTILSPWLVTFIRLDCFLRKLGRAYDGQFSFHGGTFCWRPLVLGISMDLADRKHCPMCFKWRS